MKLFFAICVLLFQPAVGGALANSPQDGSLQRCAKVLKLMGSRFEVIAVCDDSIQARNSIEAAIVEIERIEKLISSWNPGSETSKINRNAGVAPVGVGNELFELIRRSIKIAELSDGIFDISFASVDRIWRFDSTMTRLPTKEEMAASVSKINYKNILLDQTNSTVFLKETGMKIGFGGIGKGYAANQAKAVMVAMGVRNGVVNAGGDLLAWGKQENGEDWMIAITDPKDKSKMLGWLNLSNRAVVTSGDYERFVELEGIRYGHIINPKTGMPAAGVKSVTVICPDAELADALATTVFVLGEKDGLKLVNRLKDIECLIVTNDNEIATSKNLKLHLHQQKSSVTQLD